MRTIHIQEYDVLVSVTIKQFDALLIRYGKQHCLDLLDYSKTTLLKQLAPLEKLDIPESNHFVLLLKGENINEIYKRIYRIDDLLYFNPDACFHQSIFLSIGVYFIQANDRYEDALLCASIAKKYSLDVHKLNTHIEVYNASFGKPILRQNQMEEKMRKALVNHDFQVYLQPKVALVDHKIVGAEALLRWHDKELGDISTFELINLAEQNGFIREIDLYMFEQVCKLIVSWQHSEKQFLCISVNLSRVHFQEENSFLPFLELFYHYHIPSSCIEIEITESAFCTHTHHLHQVIEQIHQVGMRCSLDDFGSGYSSFASLKDICFDTIKIDRSFFVEPNEKSKMIVQAIIKLAMNLHIETLCEGIETMSQVNWLRELGCDLIQGYVFYKPMPIMQFEHLLEVK